MSMIGKALGDPKFLPLLVSEKRLQDLWSE
jgi:hypothetical protein